MTEPEPLQVRSVTIREAIDSDGERFLEIQSEGDPTLWDVLGMLGWATEVTRQQVDLRPDDN